MHCVFDIKFCWSQLLQSSFICQGTSHINAHYHQAVPNYNFINHTTCPEKDGVTVAWEASAILCNAVYCFRKATFRMVWLLPCLLTSRRHLAVPFLSSKGGKNIRMRKLVYGSEEEKLSRTVSDSGSSSAPILASPRG